MTETEMLAEVSRDAQRLTGDTGIHDLFGKIKSILGSCPHPNPNIVAEFRTEQDACDFADLRPDCYVTIPGMRLPFAVVRQS